LSLNVIGSLSSDCKVGLLAPHDFLLTRKRSLLCEFPKGQPQVPDILHYLVKTGLEDQQITLDHIEVLALHHAPVCVEYTRTIA